MPGRAVLVLALLAAFVAARWAYRRWQAGVRADAPQSPPLPAALLDGAARTWVLFTTPWCASCDVVAAELEATDPGSRLVKVDATLEPHLADLYRIRRAPTVLLADRAGEVQTRLVGLEAVRGYVRSPA